MPKQTNKTIEWKKMITLFIGGFIFVVVSTLGASYINELFIMENAGESLEICFGLVRK